MKSVKQVFVILVTVLSLVLILSACNSENTNSTNENNESDNNSEEASNEDSSGPIVIGFSQIGAESGWRTAETESIKDTLENDPQFELKFSDAQQKQENQIKALRNFIAQQVDIIALAPVVESGWETVLTEAKDADIPVILLDRRIEVEDESLYTSFIGSDFILEGENAAKELINLVGEDVETNIVELQGTVGASAANDRMEGFANIINENDKYNIIKSQTGEFTRSKGKEVMEAFLKSDGENIDVVYAHNDDMALGAIQAIEEYGLNPGEDIKIVSVDGISDIFEAVIAGKANIIVECNPLLGPQLAQAAKDLKEEKEIERWIKTEETVFVGAEAAEEALPDRKY
ncbi:simple sugar transport system substrate-binding protein [Gracilibacillus orientalis]|uniref:Simple sugar transport system substrate-binding protein n=1 Tax=Gracilibacillus orientalis TaxID=334253 RepID=A0A1I4HW56_9BACI|nr:ABC transporter substrate-binding protein [Gracilibacillus orientalis]SFL45967.1 simple sugar transport system substrate-binding protein [Gracilibacillus orientalis]